MAILFCGLVVMLFTVDSQRVTPKTETTKPTKPESASVVPVVLAVPVVPSPVANQSVSTPLSPWPINLFLLFLRFFWGKISFLV
ncbi:hypothetical protein JYU14_00195 [Simkania negevensis]|uniref:Secreted protein n=1 Tax=Simkania negevensis TaxID=83561 RepID=A0ABS3APD1_9BACT|nr:hypothetical protein [Simkania negevensis]